MKLTLTTFLALSLLGSCQPQPPQTVVAPAGPAQQQLMQKYEEQHKNDQAAIDQHKTLEQNASGDVYGVKIANVHNPAGPPQVAVDTFAQSAASALPEPTPEQKAEKERQLVLALSGQVEEFKRELGQAQSENTGLKKQLAVSEQHGLYLQNQVEEAKAALTKEQSDSKIALEKALKQKDDALAAALDAQHKADLRLLNWVVLGLAVLFAVLGGGTLWLTKGEQWQRGGLALLCSAVFFLTYWTYHQPWFIYVAGGCVIVILLGVAGVVFYEWKHHKLAQDLVATKALTEDTLTKVVAGLEEAKKAATPELQTLFTKLSQKMDGVEKQLIKQVKSTL